VSSYNKRFILIFSIFLILLSFNITTLAKEGLITSIGQNPGGLMVKVTLKDFDVNYIYSPQIEINELKDYQFTILSVGCSQKGLCSAETDFKKELKRTKELIEVMKEKDYPIIFVHLGGKLRRDVRSNKLIEEVAPYASDMVITKDSNEDGYFTKLSKEKDIPLHIIDNLSHLDNVFAEIFSKNK